MPSDILTPTQLDWSGGSLTTSHDRDGITPARLDWAGVNLTTSFSEAGLTVTVPQLDRLTSFEQVLGQDGTPSHRFMAIWQEQAEKIEEAFEAIDARDDEQDATISAVQQALALAQSAIDEILSSKRREALRDSYTNPTTVGTFSNDGTVTIAAHTRIYGDGETASVNAGSVSGYNAGNYVTVYYVDTGRTGGAVSYQATTGAIAQSGDTHIVAQGTIPAAGETSTTGTSPTAPGYTAPSSDNPDYVEP